jgi:hypothetical protein
MNIRLAPHFGQELSHAGLAEGICFYPDSTILGTDEWPDGKKAQLAALIEAHNPDAAPVSEVRVYKAPMFRKMTDAEYEAYLQIRANFPPRMQAIFDAAEYLSSDDEFWPDLVAAAEQAYGAERAAEILAPEG